MDHYHQALERVRAAGQTRIARVVGAALVLVTLAVYWPVTGHDFINFDDPDYVTLNPVVQRGLTWPGMVWAFTQSHAANWHPVTWLSHMLDVTLFGLRPGGHHATNVIFHALNGLLLFLLFSQMTGAVSRSALVAALFALHPLRVESVAWVAERKDVLSAFFGLLTLIAYARYARSKEDSTHTTFGLQHSTSKGEPNSKCEVRTANSGISNSKWYALALACFALGLMSKPMLVTWPFVMLLLDYWPLQRFALQPGKRLWGRLFPLVVEKLPFFALSVASSIATIIAQSSAGSVASLDHTPLAARLSNAAVSYWWYIGKILWPANLSVFYPHPGAWPAEITLAAALALLFVSAAALYFAPRHQYLPVGWFWYVGMLVPVIGLVQVGAQAGADRYTYLPATGVFLVAAWGVGELLPGRRWTRIAVPVATVMVLGCCLVATRIQLAHWRNGESLFRHAVAVTANNYIAYNRLGLALSLQGRFEEAVTNYQASLRIAPTFADAHNNLGFTYVQLGKLEEAIRHFRHALESKALYPNAHHNLAHALARMGNFAEAAEHFAVLTKLQPHDPDNWYNWGNMLLAQGRFGEAVDALAKVVALKPDDAEARQKLGIALAQQGRLDEAVAELKKSQELQPTAQTSYSLALALVMRGQRSEAAAWYREALRLQPDFPLALNDLAWILATAPEDSLRDGGEAVRLAERACELTQGKVAHFLGTLDAAYAEAGRFEDAIATAHKALVLAEAAGKPAIAEAARKRISLYQNQMPFRQ